MALGGAEVRGRVEVAEVADVDRRPARRAGRRRRLDRSPLCPAPFRRRQLAWSPLGAVMSASAVTSTTPTAPRSRPPPAVRRRAGPARAADACDRLVTSRRRVSSSSGSGEPRPSARRASSADRQPSSSDVHGSSLTVPGARWPGAGFPRYFGSESPRGARARARTERRTVPAGRRAPRRSPRSRGRGGPAARPRPGSRPARAGAPRPRRARRLDVVGGGAGSDRLRCVGCAGTGRLLPPQLVERGVGGHPVAPGRERDRPSKRWMPRARRSSPPGSRRARPRDGRRSGHRPRGRGPRDGRGAPPASDDRTRKPGRRGRNRLRHATLTSLTST